MKDEMTKSTLKPPFRADHVGSLLRPTAVAEARKAGVTGRTQLLSTFIEDLMDDALMPRPKSKLQLCHAA